MQARESLETLRPVSAADSAAKHHKDPISSKVTGPRGCPLTPYARCGMHSPILEHMPAHTSESWGKGMHIFEKNNLTIL